VTEQTLLRDLAVVLAVSGAVTAVFHQLRLPVVLGYLIAGVFIGPHTPPFALVTDTHTIETLAELGVILLLFSIGLEFSLRKLQRVGLIAVVVAAVEVSGMFALGYTAGQLLGWNHADSMFLGAILSISSTTIIVKALSELGLTRAKFARVVLGVLIVEDVVAIVLLVVMSGFATAGTVELRDVVMAIAGVTLFAVTLVVIGLLAVPRLLRWLAGFPVREVLTISVLGLCFAIAIIADSLGFSVALGAFLIGAVIAETPQVREVESRIESIRDVFSAVFFVAVGMQIDPRVLVSSWAVVLGLSALTIVGKVVTSAFGALACGSPPREAFRIGMSLGQIGEFSFIIAGLGRSAGVISDSIYPITVAVSAVTTLTTPFKIRFADDVAAAIGGRMPGLFHDVVAAYGATLARSDRSRRFAVSAETRRPLFRIVLVAALLMALLVMAKAAVLILDERNLSTIWFPDDVELAVWTAAGLVSIPMWIALWRSAGELSRLLVRPETGGASRVVAEAIRFAMAVVGGAIFVAVATPVFPAGWPMAVVALLVAIAAVVFWRELANVHARAERALREILSEEPPAPAEESTEPRPENLAELVRRRYPLDVALEDFILPLGPSALNVSIQELALRSRTGATIAAIYRGELAIVNPSPTESLEPGDVLLLLGSPEQVARAMKHLAALASRREGESVG
jgi:monovalent cation:H+ antiporter-2, CPA2 family